MTDQSLPGRQSTARWRSGNPTIATSGAAWVTRQRSGAPQRHARGRRAQGQPRGVHEVRRQRQARGPRTPAALRDYGRLRSVTRAAHGDLLITTGNGAATTRSCGCTRAADVRRAALPSPQRTTGRRLRASSPCPPSEGDRHVPSDPSPLGRPGRRPRRPRPRRHREHPRHRAARLAGHQHLVEPPGRGEPEGRRPALRRAPDLRPCRHRHLRARSRPAARRTAGTSPTTAAATRCRSWAAPGSSSPCPRPPPTTPRATTSTPAPGSPGRGCAPSRRSPSPVTSRAR